MRILITGGAGFVGSHTVAALLRAGHAVRLIDNFCSYYDPAEKLRNLSEIRKLAPVEVDALDIRSVDKLGASFRNFKPEAVVHLAANAGVRPSLTQPLEYASCNIQGTANVLECARQVGVRRFVFASSSSVYGASLSAPFHEDQSDLRPLSPYAASKLAGEALCRAYAFGFGLSIVCLRLFTVYGPRQRPDLAIRKFIEAAFADQPVKIYGDGSSCRDYTYVDDTANAIESALHSPATFEIVNVGGSRPVSLSDLLRLLEKQMGKRLQIQYLPPQLGDPPLTHADTSKAKKLFGFEAQTTLENGLTATIQWCRTLNSFRSSGVGSEVENNQLVGGVSDAKCFDRKALR